MAKKHKTTHVKISNKYNKYNYYTNVLVYHVYNKACKILIGKKAYKIRRYKIIYFINRMDLKYQLPINNPVFIVIQLITNLNNIKMSNEHTNFKSNITVQFWVK